MKLTLPLGILSVALAAASSFAWLPLGAAHGQQEFAGNVQQAGGFEAPSAAQTPPYPAAFLAGGHAAMQGSEYMDASGRPIVMPDNFVTPAQYGGPSPPGAGYGNGMAMAFGGAGVDQCGPHYFDVSAGVVYLLPEELFDNVPAFASIGAGIPAPAPVLNAGQLNDEYKPGWEIAMRLDIGPLSVFEATYMGMYDFGFYQSVTAPATFPNSISSAFSAYGTNNNGLIPGLDQGAFQSLGYQSDLQSTELTLRRYWVGSRPRISGTVLAGARYIRMTEDLDLFGNGPVQGTVQSSTRSWNGENDMIGFQVGGDGWICLRQGLRVGIEGKAGVYNNRFRFRNFGNFPNISPDATFLNPPADFDVSSKGNQVAFAGEGGCQIIADILPSLSIKGGYRVFYMNSLATVGGNVNPAAITSTAVYTQSDAIYHGFNGSIEFVY